MIDVEAANNDSERLVLQLIRSMETGELPDAVKTLCTEDFTWANSGLETVSGQKALFEHMANGGFASVIPILKPMTHFSADLLHIASNTTGNLTVVFTERVDHHWDVTGRDLMTPHICGVAEVCEGRISAFRDFYDVACYQQEPTDSQAGFELEVFRAAQQQGER